MFEHARFNGPGYVPDRDNPRLRGALRKVYNFMADGRWRTLEQITAETGSPEASASSHLRQLRKERHGLHTVNRRYVGHGLHEYQLIPSRGGVADGQEVSQERS